MTHPQNPNAYPEIRALLDKALLSSAGLEVLCPSRDIAVRMRWAAYAVRKQERKQAQAQGIPCAYDALSLTIHPEDDGSCMLKILKGLFNLEDAGFLVRDALTKKAV